MPTYETDQRAVRDVRRLSPESRARLKAAVRAFYADLAGGRQFRPGLRVKRVQGTANVLEMTWAPDGRATFSFGTPVREGHAHVVWRRIGSHDIFSDP